MNVIKPIDYAILSKCFGAS